MAAVTIHSDFGAQKIKSVTVSFFSLSICFEVMELDAIIFVFERLVLFYFIFKLYSIVLVLPYINMFSFKPAFSLSSFTFIKRLFSSSSAIVVVSSVYLRLLIFLLAILILACASSSLDNIYNTKYILCSYGKDDLLK